MPTWPRGEQGSTPLSRPGSGAFVIAARRLIMLTIGQPHTYARRAMVFAYSSCMTMPVAATGTSAAFAGAGTWIVIVDVMSRTSALLWKLNVQSSKELKRRLAHAVVEHDRRSSV